MNRHISQELMWKNQNLMQTPESNIRSASDSKSNDNDMELKDLIYINSSSEIYDCSANGNTFEDKTTYHGSEKLDGDRSLTKEYKNYNEIDPSSFADGIFVQNNNDLSMSKPRQNSDQSVSDEYLWFYLDPRSNVQGPFFDSQMFQWWSQGIYFQNYLMMKRKCDADFSTLQDYSNRFNGVPFNRKDIRVPPLIESLTLQLPNHSYIKPKTYNNGSITTQTRNNQQASIINDPNYIFQIMSSIPNQSPDELTKLLQKVNIQQRIPPQMGYEQSLISSSIQNGTDPFVNSVGSNSLSNFVNLRLHNHVPQTPSYMEGHIASYLKNDRFPSWGQIHQSNLTDSVWTSTSDDTIINSNPVWCQPTNEAMASCPSILKCGFHDSQHSNNIIPTNFHKSNPMQESWDNLDPAIIKIVPLSDSSNHTETNKLQKESMEQRTHHGPNSNSTWTYSENMKHPWADLVRKSNNLTGNQKSKCGFNSEHDVMYHSESSNQRKTSLTSSSSEEYDQMTCQSSDKDFESLIQWSKSYLENRPGIVDVDIGTLIELLIYVESPYELEATMRENVPQFDSICEFVKIFVEKRRPLRQRLFSDNSKKKTDRLSPGKVDDDTKWQVKSKSHGSCKKKKKNNSKN